ncbi:hypothetical protein T265_08244 [Opisthorchis viverrini]|uniref:Uncharacterized protein n=1 Tax=Opisthorchis viverrini TaxID=6198 RepID=A0A074ZKW0_OPIVI|nr:hypothetical protein T265_08244 [Opisthorchis viverrini]KER24000.1 hypothetical protein T265_08244 [Opisthorchis viverrini]
MAARRTSNAVCNATPARPGERQPLTDKNKTDPGNFGKSLDPVYQSVNPATPFFHLCLSGERQPLTDKNKTDPGNLGKSLDPVYQSVNP